MGETVDVIDAEVGCSAAEKEGGGIGVLFAECAAPEQKEEVRGRDMVEELLSISHIATHSHGMDVAMQ